MANIFIHIYILIKIYIYKNSYKLIEKREQFIERQSKIPKDNNFIPQDVNFTSNQKNTNIKQMRYDFLIYNTSKN